MSDQDDVNLADLMSQHPFNELFNAITHDFKAPLNTALAGVQLLHEALENPGAMTEDEMKNMTALVIRSLRNVLRLVDDITDVQRAAWTQEKSEPLANNDQ